MKYGSVRCWQLSVIIVLALLLQGCWGGSKSSSNRLVMELKGSMGSYHEVVLSKGETTYLLPLGTKLKAEFLLDGGTWLIQAYSREEDGKVSAVSQANKVQGRSDGLVILELLASTLETSLEPQNVTHHRILDKVDLAWESTNGGEQTFEIWRRPSSGKDYWTKIGKIASGTGSGTFEFKLAAQGILPYRYALRAVAGDAFPSQLVESEGLEESVLELTWSFDYAFPQFTYSYASQGLSTIWDQEEVPGFTDFVAHFTDEVSFAQREKLLAQEGLVIKGVIPLLLEVLVEPDSSSERYLEDWVGFHTPHFYLEPNWKVQVNSSVPTTTWMNWHLDYLRVPQAQTFTKGDYAVRIAILDTGLDPQVGPKPLPGTVRVVPGYNFIDGNTDTWDDDTVDNRKHGTTVARIIGSVMPQVTIQPVKVLDGHGWGSDFTVRQGLLYAAGLPYDETGRVNPTPAQIINLSLGQASPSSTLYNAVEQVAYRTNALMLAASGNTSSGAIVPGLSYPAGYSEVIAIGSLEPSYHEPIRAYYSHYGQGLDLVAPEASTWGAGTSYSTALVSGVAGLMLARGYAAGEVRSILENTAIDLGPSGLDWEYGHGLVNAYWAVSGVNNIVLRVYDADESLVYETKVPLKGSGLTIPITSGEYVLEAWLNVSGGAQARPGDFYFKSEPLFLDHVVQTSYELILKELF